MQTDPLGLSAGINLYRYAQNNPIRYYDNDGLKFRAAANTNAGQVSLGVGDSFVETARGIKNLVTTNPVDTAKNIYDAATHPVQTFNAIKDGYVEKSKSLRGIGSIIGDVVQTVLGGVGTKAAVKTVSNVLRPDLKGLTTPKKYFGNKTAQEASEALTKNYGLPKNVREGAETFYNPKTERSFNVHTDPAHGPPHVDIRRRGGFPERKYPLAGE